ncbi:MAG: putative two-component response-regulatory protein YehT [Sphingobacterium sp.]|jgi:response regulator of citrate/malate metabolism|nr:putative two-component response-regulatory protein YehT [Sphingobacterium sp.]
MERFACIVVEDDVFSIDMLKDYINRKKELVLSGIGTELSELKQLLEYVSPSIIFLDLIIPPGESMGFHYGELPQSSFIILTSAIPLYLYNGPLPKGTLYELPKPISYENFSKCVDKVIVKLKNKNCE